MKKEIYTPPDFLSPQQLVDFKRETVRVIIRQLERVTLDRVAKAKSTPISNSVFNLFLETHGETFKKAQKIDKDKY